MLEPGQKAGGILQNEPTPTNYKKENKIEKNFNLQAEDDPIESDSLDSSSE
jgi:hypothetical protein